LVIQERRKKRIMRKGFIMLKIACYMEQKVRIFKEEQQQKKNL